MKSETIKAMSLEEKIAQLCGTTLGALLENGNFSKEKFDNILPHGVGHVCQFASGVTLNPTNLAKLVREIDDYNCKKTESKIPILFHEEAITGVAAKGATITPQMIGMSCTWSPELVYENAKSTAKQMKQLGAYHALSPMLDVITDSRWGRGEEGYGEEARLVAQFGTAFIEGLQSEGVSATAKHFAGYGVENQEMAFFRNETLFPFEVAIRKGGARAVMPGYHAFHDVPCSVSSKLLTDVLRGDLGFDGAVVSDYFAIKNVHTSFNYSNSLEDAACQALNAGVDVDYPNGLCFKTLYEQVKNGKISEEIIDKAVARVLKLKANIPSKQKINAEQNIEEIILDTTADRQRALKCAQRSIVLLKNNGILPLDKQKKQKIALVGPNANSYYSLLGDYTWMGIAEYFHRTPTSKENPHLVTLKEGLENTFNAEIVFERGCDWSKDDDINQPKAGGDERALGNIKFPLEQNEKADFERAIKIAKDSDVIIAAMGENRYLCGECCDRENVALPLEQEKFVRALCQTGKPVVLVIFGGRPMAIENLSHECSAVLYAWYPGEEGGTAVADIIFGNVNPSAKLTVTLPNKNESVPVCYQNQTDGKREMYHFGFGLSYTKFDVSNVKIPNKISCEDNFFDVSFDVTNSGEMAGIETIQLYVKPKNSDKKRLISHAQAFLTPKESKRIIIRFYLEQFAEYTADGELKLSPQNFTLEVGQSVENICANGKIAIVGNVKTLKCKEKYFADVL